MLLTGLKTMLACLALASLVPLTTYFATGSWQQAWRAMRGYGVAMGLIMLAAVGVAIAALLSGAA